MPVSEPIPVPLFDYIGIPHFQRWMNGGKFDDGQLSKSQKDIRDFYKSLLNFTLNSDALMGKFKEIQRINRNEAKRYGPGIYSYVRWTAKEKLIVVVNFSWSTTSDFELKVPEEVIKTWDLKDGFYPIKDQLCGSVAHLKVTDGKGIIELSVKPSESFIFNFEKNKTLSSLKGFCFLFSYRLFSIWANRDNFYRYFNYTFYKFNVVF